MNTYNTDIMNALDISSPTSEGGIFSNYEQDRITQIEFIEKWLNIINPNHIVEIGTNKANFVYICLVNNPNIKIDTYDKDCRCVAGIDYLKNIFQQSSLNFYCGDSLTVLDEHPPHTSDIDLFYVDGYHSFKMTSNDLNLAIKYNSKYILVDDFYDKAEEGGVPEAIVQCLFKNGWKMLDLTSTKDHRGMAIFSK